MKIRVINVIKLNLVLLLIFISYFLINRYTGIYIPCVFNLVTGYKCPGCGITHSIFALLAFNFKEAFMYNPLVFIYLPFIGCYYFYLNYIYIYNKKENILKNIPDFVVIVLILITILYGILRNVY